MFYHDHKKAVATIISNRRDGKGEKLSMPVEMKPEVVKHEDGEIDGRHTAMEDFMSAHKEGSPMKMAEALKNFVDIHHAMMAKESEE